MAAVSAVPEGRRRTPFADSTPAQIRAALVPSDAVEFDRQWRRVMDQAADLLDLAPVHTVLESWRRVAWITTDLGPQRYRQMRADADERLRTGDRASGSVPWHQLKAELGLPE